jgi:hypothetical protein
MQESQLARDNQAEAAQLAAELPLKHQPLVNKTRYATPLNVQMRQLMRRFLLVYWRSPAYNVTKYLLLTLKRRGHLRMSFILFLDLLHGHDVVLCIQVTRMLMTVVIALLYVSPLGSHVLCSCSPLISHPIRYEVLAL